MLEVSPLSPFYSVHDPNPWDGAAHIQVGSPVKPLWKSSLGIPRIVSLDGSKFYQVGSQDYPSWLE